MSRADCNGDALELDLRAFHGEIRIDVDGSKGDAENVSPGALVLIKDDSPGVGKSFLKFLEGSAGCSTKTIDGLIGIADSKYVFLLAAQQFGKSDIAGIAVLKFVNQNKAGALALFFQQPGIGLQQPNGFADLHAEGAQVALLQQAHGIGIDARNLAPARHDLFRAELFHHFRFAITRQVGAGLEENLYTAGIFPAPPALHGSDRRRCTDHGETRPGRRA